MASTDLAFTGSVPKNYDQFMGPLLFRPYAIEVARRAQALNPRRILETAAGTGIVTQALAESLPEADIVATDLKPEMLAIAADKPGLKRVQLRPADAQDLPFDDKSFDLVVCQFGVMFYPDKPKGASEARRVLRDDGTYLAIIWDRIERNPVSKVLAEAVAAEFPDDPPRFLERAPFGYADPLEIERDMRAGGFTDVAIETVGLSSRLNAKEAAIAMCAGSPMTAEIAERGEGAIERATRAAEAALQQFDGQEMPMSALFVTAVR
jgi:ubiquinone/menaquinone biosynthesis C-methylase UbiE